MEKKAYICYCFSWVSYRFGEIFFEVGCILHQPLLHFIAFKVLKIWQKIRIYIYLQHQPF